LVDDRTRPSAPAKAALSLEIALFLGLLIVYSYFIQPSGANALSRYDAVLAIAEHNTTVIDAYHVNTDDKGYFDGHYYSDKPPGVALLSLPFYLGLRALLSPLRLWPLNDQYVVYLLNLFVAAAPTALLAVLIVRALRRLRVAEGPAYLAAVAYGLGTLALPFATLYFGHQTAAFFGFAAFYALFTARERRHPARWAFLGGLLVGLAVLAEYPLGIVAVLLGLYVLVRLPGWKNAAAYALGGIPAALALGAYNYVSFGSPLSLSYTHVFLQQFAGMHDGFFGVRLPNPTVLFVLLFSGKGLLTNSPVLLLAAVGLWALWREGRWRAEALVCLGVLFIFPLYNSGYFLPFGGWTPGPRFLVPMLPFAAVPLGVALGRWRWARWLGVPLAAASIAAMFLCTATVPLIGENWYVPALNRWLPSLIEGQAALNLGTQRFGLQGAASLWPLVGLLALSGLLALLARQRAASLRSARLGYLATGALLALLIWPAPLPGLAMAAIDLAPGDPEVVVQSVRELSPTPAGAERAEVVVRNLGGLAPNIGLWMRAEDVDRRFHHDAMIWPVTVLPGATARFVVSWWPDAGEPGGPRLMTVRVLHWSLSYPLAEVRAPLYATASGPLGEEPSIGVPAYN